MLIQELKKLQLRKEIVTLNRDCGDDDQTGTIEMVNDEVTILCMYNSKPLALKKPYLA